MSKRTYYLLAVLVMLLAAALRLWQLNTLPLGVRPDEVNSLSLVDNIRAGRTGIGIFYPVPQQGETVREGLYYTLLTVVSVLTGSGTLGTRIFSAWAGIITVALVYTLGVRLYGRAAGLAAMLCMTGMGVALFLSHTLLTHALLPLYTTALLVALARAFPVYRGERDEGTTTASFAALGVLLAVGLYLHPISLLLMLAVMVFIVFLLFVATDKRPRLSDVGFALLLIMILSVPYVITSINRPMYAASSRIIGDYGSIINSIVNSLGGVFISGDLNPAHNIPGRPLLDLVSGVLALIGLLVCIRGWRMPRFALLLVMLVLMLPGVMLTQGAPNFLAFAPILPLIALLFGLGIATIAENTRPVPRRIFYVCIGVLVIFNLVWTGRDVFTVWPARDDVQTLYNAKAGALAHYLDLTADTTPTALCDVTYDAGPVTGYSAAELVQRLMNRKDAPMRLFNCRGSLVFINAGAGQQVILPDAASRGTLPTPIQTWLNRGTSVPVTGLDDGTVIDLSVSSVLADQMGAFITTTPALLLTGDPSNEIVAPPPIRLGLNVTWLGYQPDSRTYRPGDTLPVVTYWRAEGPVPGDLRLFVHLLSDPSTIVRQRDVLYVEPSHLQDRDVWLNLTEISLPQTLLAGDYRVSVGAYRDQDQKKTRLVVVGDQLPPADRLLLYPVHIIAP